MNKYHINGQGKAAVCRAKNGKCPFGDSDSHYSTKEEALKAIDEMNEKLHGIIKEVKTEDKIPVVMDYTTKAELKYNLREAKKKFEEEDIETPTFWTRCQSSIVVEYTPTKKETRHFSRDRAIKDQMMKDMFGEGELVGHFKVRQEQNGEMAYQIVGIYNTGQIKIYGEKSKKLITSFIPQEKRIEIMMLKAGLVANQEWLDEVKQNKAKLDSKWAKHLKNEKAKKKEQKRESAFGGKIKESEEQEKKIIPEEKEITTEVRGIEELLPPIKEKNKEKEVKTRETENSYDPLSLPELNYKPLPELPEDVKQEDEAVAIPEEKEIHAEENHEVNSEKNETPKKNKIFDIVSNFFKFNRNKRNK